MLGVIKDLRTQLSVSITSHDMLQSQSTALTELQNQMHNIAQLQPELLRQAGDIGSLKSQIGASAERHTQLICQVFVTLPVKFAHRLDPQGIEVLRTACSRSNSTIQGVELDLLFRVCLPTYTLTLRIVHPYLMCVLRRVSNLFVCRWISAGYACFVCCVGTEMLFTDCVTGDAITAQEFCYL